MRAGQVGGLGRSNALVMGASALLLFSAVAYAGDPAQDDSAAQQITGAAGTEQREYFGSDPFAGDGLIVNAVLTEVLGQKSFVFGGSKYGDEPLLVLSTENADAVREGDDFQVSHIVEQFHLADQRHRYGLLDNTYYDEEFLVAHEVRQGVSTRSETTTSSS
ncbi:hypothetical protein [Lentzea sp. NEAU-D7]|uniref:hypothetical protein n=1 Tax=Lentzea sp. NEAU-D7 TaxID=2994667 RepID=UPI00224AD909|nr:hypothetical protein [Lentzea sp. NEAU-D7]MCX2948843.1 hypothetical protein [Lentzea sp. NEAU-D7]